MFVLLSLLVAPVAAQAQGQMPLLAYNLRTDAFPSMTFFLEAYDAQGNFVSGIQPSEIALTENDVPVAVSLLEEIEPGIEFTLAFNPSRDLARRFGEATQFEQIRQNLLDWAGATASPGGAVPLLSPPKRACRSFAAATPANLAGR